MTTLGRLEKITARWIPARWDKKKNVPSATWLAMSRVSWEFVSCATLFLLSATLGTYGVAQVFSIPRFPHRLRLVLVVSAVSCVGCLACDLPRRFPLAVSEMSCRLAKLGFLFFYQTSSSFMFLFYILRCVALCCLLALPFRNFTF